MFSPPSKLTYLNFNDPGGHISKAMVVSSTERDSSRFLQAQLSEVQRGPLELMGYLSIHELSHLGSSLRVGTSRKH